MPEKFYSIKNVDKEDPFYLRIYKQAEAQGVVQPPIIVSQNGWILDGNKRYCVSEELQIRLPPPIVIPLKMDRKQAWEIHRAIPPGWVGMDGSAQNGGFEDMEQSYDLGKVAKNQFIAGIMVHKLKDYPWPVYETLGEYLVSQTNP